MSILDLFFSDPSKTEMPSPEAALPGRDTPMPVRPTHRVLGTPIAGPLPEGAQEAIFGLGCYWGAEQAFWKVPGVISTAVGFAGGITPNPTYREVCTGRTGHAEAVRVVFDPGRVSYADLLKVFWEYHDPTQGMRQGNDLGTQYRSMIVALDDEQRRIAEASRAAYQAALSEAELGRITTEIIGPTPFYYAEDEHQQYLERVPNGYCPNHRTGVELPDGFVAMPLEYIY
jgi:peptide-methionine (S)-S-oxide reductase